jgi:hypothetical protein
MSGTLSNKCKKDKKNEWLMHIFCLDLSGSDRPPDSTVNQPPHGFEGSSPSFPTTQFSRLKALQSLV